VKYLFTSSKISIMKKLLCLSLIFSAIISTSVLAQPVQTTQPAKPATDQAAMLQQAKEKQSPLMVEKTGLTLAQANRVIEINFEIRQQAGATLQGLNDADRSAKLAELKALKEKKYSEIPLTADQIKAVYAFYEDMGKNATQKRGN
jgi:hypothetical protein